METIDQPGPLLEGRFEGRTDFIQLVRDALGAASQAGWRELILSDASFYDCRFAQCMGAGRQAATPCLPRIS
ncbi:MAG: hypothetical protein IPJ36_05130 [Simplicispira sp.]|nr:hypothetical protein [Simplicispira sp.]